MFCCNLLFSQSFNNIVEEADFLSKNKDYYSSIYLYKKALNKKTVARTHLIWIIIIKLSWAKGIDN